MMRYRTLFGLALLLGTLHIHAQNADGRYYKATAPLDLVSLKMVTQAMVDLDPYAQVTHSDDMRIVHVRVHPSVTDAEIRNAMAGARVAVEAGVPDLRAYLPPPNPDAPPAYVVTGDDAGDLQRYRAAAEAWNRQHPERAVAVEPAHIQQR